MSHGCTGVPGVGRISLKYGLYSTPGLLATPEYGAQSALFKGEGRPKLSGMIEFVA